MHHPTGNQSFAGELRCGRKASRPPEERRSLLFGRGGEEIDALRQADVDVEIVPGITAAVAAASAAEISLTDRRYADRLLLVSAHRAPGKAEPDWRGLSDSRTTIVVHAR